MARDENDFDGANPFRKQLEGGGGGPENLDFWEPRDLFLLITNKIAVFM
jgi:hypothetical protein